MNRDFMGIVLELGTESTDNEVRRLYNDVRDGNFIDLSVYGFTSLSESSSEPLNYQGLKLIQEKYGRGVSLTAGETEYRFVSDKFNTEQLESKLKYLLESQDAEKVQSWLDNNTYCYLTQSLNESAVKEWALDQVIENGDFVSFEGDVWVVFDNAEAHDHALIFKNKKEFKVVPISQLKKATGSISRKLKNASKKVIRFSGNWDNFVKKLNEDEGAIDESTQTADVATKVDQDWGSKYPVKGLAYEFEDGVFVVEEIIDDVVYLFGPDDEYYSMKIDDFQNEVIAPMNEAELEEEPKFEKIVKASFPGWTFEKVNDDTDKTGIVMYALAKGNNDVVIFLHLGEETYEIYSEEDEEAPELEGKLSGLKSGLSKMAKYFGNSDEIDEAEDNDPFVKAVRKMSLSNIPYGEMSKEAETLVKKYLNKCKSEGVLIEHFRDDTDDEDYGSRGKYTIHKATGDEMLMFVFNGTLQEAKKSKLLQEISRVSGWKGKFVSEVPSIDLWELPGVVLERK